MLHPKCCPSQRPRSFYLAPSLQEIIHVYQPHTHPAASTPIHPLHWVFLQGLVRYLSPALSTRLCPIATVLTCVRDAVVPARKLPLHISVEALTVLSLSPGPRSLPMPCD